MYPRQHPLRLAGKHGDGAGVELTAADGRRLQRQQSLRAAAIAGLIVIIIFCVLWVMVTQQFGRVFPWATLVLGYGIGFAVRRAGRGVDWRFPVLAALLAMAGSLFANIVVAASVSADDLGAGTLDILRSVTTMTWPVFFDEVWNIADSLFAVCAGALAAFYAPRRLSRGEYYALRLWREEQ